jgi:hypothetical protein
MYHTLTPALAQTRRDDIRRYTRRHSHGRAGDLKRRTGLRRLRLL